MSGVALPERFASPGYVGTIISGPAGTFEVNRNDWTSEQFGAIVAYVGMGYKPSGEFDSVGGGGWGYPYIPHPGVLPPLPKVMTPEEWRAYYIKLWLSGEVKKHIAREPEVQYMPKKVTISTSRGKVEAYEVDTIWGVRYFDVSVPTQYLPYTWNSIVSAKMTQLIEGLYRENASKAEILTYFGQYYQSGKSGLHEGIDISVGEGTPLYSLADGVVMNAGGGKVNAISVYNEEMDVTYTYMHSQNISINIGGKISKGDLIAEEGKVGTFSYHAHIEISDGRYSGGHASLSDHALKSLPTYEFAK